MSILIVVIVYFMLLELFSQIIDLMEFDIVMLPLRLNQNLFIFDKLSKSP